MNRLGKRLSRVIQWRLKGIRGGQEKYTNDSSVLSR